MRRYARWLSFTFYARDRARGLNRASLALDFFVIGFLKATSRNFRAARNGAGSSVVGLSRKFLKSMLRFNPGISLKIYISSEWKSKYSSCKKSFLLFNLRILSYNLLFNNFYYK